MGAESRVDIIKGKTAQGAFREAQERAGQESGYSYSGTISQAAGYFMATNIAMLELDALDFANNLIETNRVQKWEAAGLVPIVEAVGTRTVELTVDVTGKSYEQREKIVRDAVRAKLRAGEGIVSLRDTEAEKRTKIVASNTEGATVTGYRVNYRHTGKPVLFPTLAAAKAHAKALLEKGGWDNEYTITKVTIREDGQPLAVVKRVPVKTTVKVTATVGKPSKSAPSRWAAAGVYSC